MLVYVKAMDSSEQIFSQKVQVFFKLFNLTKICKFLCIDTFMYVSL